ncbi:hypothetical protein [Stenotrophomonas bentonitica]
MRALPDKWNPRIWIRDWINAPSQADIAYREAGIKRSREFREFLRTSHLTPDEVRATESRSPDPEVKG